MKKIPLFFCIIVISAITQLSCKKAKSNADEGCGCSTDSTEYYATYNSFLGNSYNGYLNYISDGTQPGWYAGVNIPNTNYYGICRICNLNLPALKAFTDTSSKRYLIPIYFAGKLKKLCPGESFGIYTLPETVFFYIKIDSLKKG